MKWITHIILLFFLFIFSVFLNNRYNVFSQVVSKQSVFLANKIQEDKIIGKPITRSRVVENTIISSIFPSILQNKIPIQPTSFEDIKEIESNEENGTVIVTTTNATNAISDNDISEENESENDNDNDNESESNNESESESENDNESENELETETENENTSTLQPPQQSSQGQQKVRVDQQQLRHEQRKNKRRASLLLRSDGYYIKKAPFKKITNAIPAFPKTNSSAPYSLVLVTTADVSANYHTYKINNVIKMFNLFQRSFNFKGIVFTTSDSIISLANEEKVTVVTSFPKNVYGMPILRDMLVKAREMFDSDYYGYINSDILLSLNLFEVLDICKQNALLGNISLRHEIAGRVYEVKIVRPLPHDSLQTYQKYLRDAYRLRKSMRHRHSADYFIYSRYFNFSTFDPAVIGRQRIDNYLLSIPHQRPEIEEDAQYMVGTLEDKFVSKGHLIDASYNVFGAHLGLDGYKTRIRKENMVKDDINWNLQFIRNYKKAFGSLEYNHYRLDKNQNCLQRDYVSVIEKKRDKLVH